MKQEKVQFSIRWKLLTIMICLLVSVLAVSTYLQVANQKKFYVDELGLRIHLIKEKLISRGWTLSGHLSRQVENGLATVNLSQISEILKKSVDEDSELYYTVLTDNSGRTYIHTLKPEMELEVLEGQDEFTIYQQPRVYEHSYYGESVIEFVVPIEISAKPWGALRLGFNLDILNQEAEGFEKDNELKIQTMIRHSIYAVSFFILISVISILILSERLLRPLGRLTRAANKLADGDFSVADTIKIDSKDEIGVLARAFADMSKELSTSYLKLQNYNLKLEHKVKERTAELALARDEAINANQSKSDFLSMVSHEIRTPMNAIIGLTQLSLKTDLNSTQHEYLTHVKYSADSLMLIINDLLDMSKIEAGQLRIEEVNFNIESVLIHLNTLVQFKAEEKNLNLNFSIADDVPHIINGDPLRLGQILLNLVNNAIKFTDVGFIQITIELANGCSQEEGRLMLQFSVKDTGIGLTQKQIDGLFMPFAQAHMSTTRLYGGTGLGLYICRKLVGLMGGTISVKSKLNAGSDFIFTLCMKQSNAIVSKSDQGFNPKIEKLVGSTHVGGKILVVDDHLINLEVAKALLEDEGFDISLADSGQKALQMIKETQFDLLLMDLRMPGMDGFETTRLIRTQSGYTNLPIVALTAQSTEEEKIKCKNHGMTDFVNKPIELEQLLQTLGKYISPKVIEHSDAPFESNKTENSTIVDLDLSGIDVQKGLNTVLGNEQKYHHLLTIFEQQFSDVLHRIKEYIKSGNNVLAGQLAHGLIGVSGNIAALKLAACAGKLESALQGQNNNLNSLIEQCEQALEQVLSDIKIIKANNIKHGASIEQQKITDFKSANIELNKLTALLELNSLDIDQCFHALKACVDTSGFADQFERLDQSIAVFDFKNALLITQEIAQELAIDRSDNDAIFTDNIDKPKLLIVDDVPVNIKVLAEVLRDKYTIQIATNGDDAALISTAEPQPDLILLDIEMPEMNGYELCLKLKEDVLTQQIPVIFITARTDDIDEKIGLAMGAVDYITKPFNTSVVQARVHSHMESKLRSDKLEQLASMDSLTEVPNRRMFDDFLEQEWQRSRRSQKWLSMIFIDIDFFKNFNDFYGHAVGDQCLRIIAKTLKDSLKRNSDFLARYGGEEFVAILPETNADAAFLIAESMRVHVQNLNIPHIPSQGFSSVTISLGVATLLPSQGTKPGDLIQKADKAVYEAKSNGRNQVK